MKRLLPLAICGLLLAGAPASTAMATESAPVVSPAGSQTSWTLLTQVPKPAWLGTNYVGDAACLPCHQDKVNSYHQTAHHLTSSWPTEDTIHGSFSPGANILKTRNTNLFFEMESNENGFFQTAVLRVSPAKVLRHKERFDVVVGSGRKGQTYLYWHGDQLFELPVSYWVERGIWMNSPGLELYADGTANFTRPITPRCLECHANSFKSLDPAGNRFEQTSLVLGITCEKCHGPGREHVARYGSASPPSSVAVAAIINPARLPRDRQMDVCGLCHAGAGVNRGPALTFKPGDVLTNDLELQLAGPNTPVDVHGNQVPLLERSRCYQSNPAMNCFTCHDVHVPQRDIKAFASRCLTCHHVENCGTFAKLGHAIDDQCVVCHMPLKETDMVLASADGQKYQPKVRNHRIAIYPDVHLP